MRAGVDANGDGSLNDDPGGGASEVTHAVIVYVVQIDEMFVWDVALPSNIATVQDNVPVDLLVMETANGDAKIKIDVSGRPQTSAAGANVLWHVDGESVTGNTSGNFGSDDPQVTLTPSNGNREFVVTLGFDDNANGMLESAEIERAASVFVIPVLDIQATTFIKQNWVDHDNDGIGQEWIFNGNERINAQGEAIFDRGSNEYKTRQKLLIIPLEAYDSDGIKDGSVENLVGRTEQFDKPTSLGPDGKITQAAKDDPSLDDGNMKIEYGTTETDRMYVSTTRITPTKLKIVFDMAANNPLIDYIVSPDIDYDWELIIDYTNPRAPTWQLTGTHDGFPCYELYINDQRIFGRDSGSETVYSLPAPQEHGVNLSGDITQ